MARARTMVDRMVETAALDWLAAFGMFAYGGYQNDPKWIGFGLIGFLMAWINPARHVHRWMRKRLSFNHHRR